VKNSSVLLFSAVSGGIIGMLIGAIAGAGTNVLLPGLGLVIAGSALIISVKTFGRSGNLP
jgi:hypothetical protein